MNYMDMMPMGMCVTPQGSTCPPSPAITPANQNGSMTPMVGRFPDPTGAMMMTAHDGTVCQPMFQQQQIMPPMPLDDGSHPPSPSHGYEQGDPNHPGMMMQPMMMVRPMMPGCGYQGGDNSGMVQMPGGMMMVCPPGQMPMYMQAGGQQEGWDAYASQNGTPCTSPTHAHQPGEMMSSMSSPPRSPTRHYQVQNNIDGKVQQQWYGPGGEFDDCPAEQKMAFSGEFDDCPAEQQMAKQEAEIVYASDQTTEDAVDSTSRSASGSGE